LNRASAICGTDAMQYQPRLLVPKTNLCGLYGHRGILSARHGSEKASPIPSQSERCRNINHRDLSTWAIEASSTGAKKPKDTVSLFMCSIKTLPRPARQRASLLASKTSFSDHIFTRPPHQPTLACSSPDHFISRAPRQPTTCTHEHLVVWPLSAGDGRIK